MLQKLYLSEDFDDHVDHKCGNGEHGGSMDIDGSLVGEVVQVVAVMWGNICQIFGFSFGYLTV